jgi:phage gp46-like protein
MDIALHFDPAAQSIDMSIAGPDLAVDAGLRTAIIVSLFSDAKARPDDILPDAGGPTAAPGDRRGWWGDFYVPDSNDLATALGVAGAPVDRIGSRLWLLSREKQLPSVLARAKEYAEEALGWLIDDKIAATVDVFAEISAPGVLGLLITITRPSGEREEHRFDTIWSAS